MTPKTCLMRRSLTQGMRREPCPHEDSQMLALQKAKEEHNYLEMNGITALCFNKNLPWGLLALILVCIGLLVSQHGQVKAFSNLDFTTPSNTSMTKTSYELHDGGPSTPSLSRLPSGNLSSQKSY